MIDFLNAISLFFSGGKTKRYENVVKKIEWVNHFPHSNIDFLGKIDEYYKENQKQIMSRDESIVNELSVEFQRIKKFYDSKSYLGLAHDVWLIHNFSKLLSINESNQSLIHLIKSENRRLEAELKKYEESKQPKDS